MTDSLIGMGPPSRRIPTVLIGGSGAWDGSKKDEGGGTVNFVDHWTAVGGLGESGN